MHIEEAKLNLASAGVSPKTVRDIWNRRTWVHATTDKKPKQTLNSHKMFSARPGPQTRALKKRAAVADARRLTGTAAAAAPAQPATIDNNNNNNAMTGDEDECDSKVDWGEFLDTDAIAGVLDAYDNSV